MPPFLRPVGGLSGFVDHLADIADGRRRPYPLYCALLYTVAEGPDRHVAHYVATNWDELDAMTAKRCLIFVVGDEPDAKSRRAAHGGESEQWRSFPPDFPPFPPREVYRLAEYLGVRPTALPCAVFFVRPRASREVLRLRLADYVPEPHSSQQMTRSFRGIAAAIQTCRDVPVSERLECLREELLRERQLVVGETEVSSSERLSAAASTIGSVEKVLVSGKTIATMLRMFF